MEPFDYERLTLDQQVDVREALYQFCVFNWDLMLPGIEEFGRGPVQFFIADHVFGSFSLSAWEVGGGPGIGFNPKVFRLGWRKDYLGRIGAWITKRHRFADRYARYRHLKTSEYKMAVILHECFHAVGSFWLERFQDKVEAIDALAGPAPYEQHEWIPIALKAYTRLLISEIPRATADQFKAICDR